MLELALSVIVTFTVDHSVVKMVSTPESFSETEADDEGVAVMDAPEADEEEMGVAEEKDGSEEGRDGSAE